MDIYKELGVKKLINAAGTYTAIGASKMSQETLNAMQEASGWNVSIAELLATLRKHIAVMTHNEDSFLCNSCSTALYLATAAFVSLHYNRPFELISKEEVAQSEVLAFWGQHIPYDHAIEQLGVKLHFIGYPSMERAVSPETVLRAIRPHTVYCYFAANTSDGYYGEGCLNLADIIRICKEKEIPVLVDAAAQLPPKSNLWRFTEMGADIVCFSGGKDLAGPQASGLMLGRRRIISVLEEFAFPNYGCGRLMKIGREEMVGLYAAIKQYLAHDENARLAWCEKQVAHLIKQLESSEGFYAERTWPNEAGQPIPRAFVHIRTNQLTPAELRAKLLEGDPGIFCYSGNKNGVYINPMCLGEGQMDIIAQRLLQIDQEIKKRKA